MSRLVGLAAVIVFGLTACGSSVDEEAWRADVEAELGAPVADWAMYRDVWTDVCDDDEDAFALFVAVGLDQGESLDQMRTNIKHACPDRLVEVEAFGP
jgi:hypothetical protein